MSAEQKLTNETLNASSGKGAMHRAAAKVFGTRNGRVLKKHLKSVKQIAGLEESMKKLRDEEFPEYTAKLKDRLKSGEELDAIIPEAFALVREAANRVMGMRHYDVQILGGLVLHSGNIAEMRTGEGKTLVATLPSFVNALTGNQVHVVTVNDYLAKRDAMLMSDLYHFLGVKVGFLQSKMHPQQRKAIYEHADILYGTNSEFAFDYLRDNMAPSANEQAQRGLHYAIVDEVDSILIDEARTPLIISGQSESDDNIIHFMNEKITQFSHKKIKEDSKDAISEAKEDIVIIEKSGAIHLTDKGYEKIEQILISEGVISVKSDLYDPNGIYIVKALETAARANFLFQKDVDYVVTAEGKVEIINPTTGRIDFGRRWSEGLHQAVEAKEGVEIKPENRTMASISLQNFFKMYTKLSGMTGTGDTEASEFNEIYGMEVTVIPTHRPNQRQDRSDKVFLSREAKHAAVVEEIVECHNSGRPVLVGTDSVDESYIVAQLLEQRGVPFDVLNAKNHEKEANIIAQAGRKGAVTISTNMAGRGTDIILGGNAKDLIEGLEQVDEVSAEAIKLNCKKESEEVRELGGLHVISTTRNESRRVDNQLKGRSGRQGDPGSSQFYVSFEDKLLRAFGNSGIMQLILSADIQPHECIEHPLIDKAIEKAQIQCEGQGSKVRAELVKYDNIVNMQRLAVYEMRNEWLHADAEAAKSQAIDLLKSASEEVLNKFLPENTFEEAWDADGMDTFIHVNWGIEPFIEALLEKTGERNSVRDELHTKIEQTVEKINSQLPEDLQKDLAVTVVLNTIDKLWFDQIDLLNNLREGIHLRGYANKNPLQEYGKDSLEYFKEMIATVTVDFSSAYFASGYATVNAFIEHQQRQQAQGDTMLDTLEEGDASIAEFEVEDESQEAGSVEQPVKA
ncbi:preprotein translocase subunit SecA [Vibrio owensii]|uniref:preprotein translocase subunit SecA n=1 Tax=Vibrio harveyi group TaxID=717610 RepID=UPI003CC645D5